MTEINFTSHTDAYNSAKDFYEQIRNIKNPYTLSVGVSVIELGLKSMIEKEMGYLPKEMHVHSLRALCIKVNELNINGFKMPYKTFKHFKNIAKFYEGGKYYGDEPNRGVNYFTENDFKNVDTKKILYFTKRWVNSMC